MAVTFDLSNPVLANFVYYAAIVSLKMICVALLTSKRRLGTAVSKSRGLQRFGAIIFFFYKAIQCMYVIIFISLYVLTVHIRGAVYNGSEKEDRKRKP